MKLNRVVPEDAADVYVKLEFETPAGSTKDRIALAMIEKAERDGNLKPGGTITSRNTGIGLAMVATAKGYHIIIVMPETMSVECRKRMKGYGAELILTPGSEGMKGSIAKAEELVKEKSYYMPMQFDNPENPNIHELTTGPEIISAMNGIGKSVDAFVAGVGTGGTLSGIGRALKKENPNTKVYALEPSESPLLKDGKTGKHGIAAGFIATLLYLFIENIRDGGAKKFGKEVKDIIGDTVELDTLLDYIKKTYNKAVDEQVEAEDNKTKNLAETLVGNLTSVSKK